jgi:hypothetical protein
MALERTRIGSIGKKSCDRRRLERREGTAWIELIPSHSAFDRLERMVFKAAERRRRVRRCADVSRAVARIGSP